MRTLVAVLALAACGGITTNPGRSSHCTVTLSGAVTGTYDCGSVSAGYDSAQNLSAVGFSFAGPPQVSSAVGFNGTPSSGKHYKNTDADSRGGLVVVNGSGAATQAWAACAANAGSNSGCNNSGAAVGSFDLSFSSVGDAFSGNGGTVYSTGGTLTATLQPLTGQSGTVTATVSF